MSRTIAVYIGGLYAYLYAVVYAYLYRVYVAWCMRLVCRLYGVDRRMYSSRGVWRTMAYCRRGV